MRDIWKVFIGVWYSKQNNDFKGFHHNLLTWMCICNTWLEQLQNKGPEKRAFNFFWKHMQIAASGRPVSILLKMHDPVRNILFLWKQPLQKWTISTFCTQSLLHSLLPYSLRRRTFSKALRNGRFGNGSISTKVRCMAPGHARNCVWKRCRTCFLSSSSCYFFQICLLYCVISKEFSNKFSLRLCVVFRRRHSIGIE